MNESKILAKGISCECRCKFDGVTRMISGAMINADVSVKIKKNIMYVKKIILGIPLHVVVKMVNIWQLLFEIQ